MKIFKICLFIFHSMGLYLGGSASYTLRYLFIFNPYLFKTQIKWITLDFENSEIDVLLQLLCELNGMKNILERQLIFYSQKIQSFFRLLPYSHGITTADGFPYLIWHRLLDQRPFLSSLLAIELETFYLLNIHVINYQFIFFCSSQVFQQFQ